MDNDQLIRNHSPFKAIEINSGICNGCNRCVRICPMDVLAANPKKGEVPVVLYPEECWFCGSCAELCPLQEQGAVRVVIPLPMRVSALRGKPTSERMKS